MTAPALSPELGDLGVALGILRDDGDGLDFNSGWFDDPGGSVSSALADERRRDALVRFVESTLGEDQHVERDGVTLLPLLAIAELVDGPAPDLRMLLSIDDRPDDHVAVGLAVSFHVADPSTTSVELSVPLYRTGKQVGETISQPLVRFPLLDGAPIELGASVRLGDGRPDDSGFALREVALAVSLPVSDPGGTSLRLDLLGLRLPGSTEPSDLRLGGPDADVADVVLGVLLGVVRAEAGALGVAGEAGLAALDLLGLGDHPSLPPLDVDDLLADGTTAVRDWFADTLGTATARDAWLERLGVLVGGALDAGDLSIDLGGGPVQLRLGLSVADGADGHRRVTPRVGIALANAGGLPIVAEAAADLFTVNTFDGSLTALPAIEVDIACGGTTPLVDTTPVKVGTARLGLTIEGGVVRPLIRLENCVVDGTTHPVLDLSNADAAVASAGSVARDLVGSALDALGDAAPHLRALLGVDPPDPTVPELDAGRLLSNPLEALAAWWRSLVFDHPTHVPTVLGHLRDLVATDAAALLPIEGAGTEADPWSFRIATRTSIDCWRDGDRLTVAASAGFRTDELGARCTVVATTVRAELARIDLAASSVSLLTGVSLEAAARGRGVDEARLALGPVELVADHIGVRAGWTNADGFDVELVAPALRAFVDDRSIPLTLPTRGPVAGLSPETWRSIEHLAAILAEAAPFGLVRDLVDLAGWSLAGERGSRLSLAELVDRPDVAMRDWARDLIADEATLTRLITVVARLATGTGGGLIGAVSGVGSEIDPIRVPLGLGHDAPAVSFSLGPDGPALSPVGAHAIETWVPGLAGFDANALADAVEAEAAANRTIADLAAGREHLADGMAALMSRLTGTDGLVAAPAGAIPGVDVVRHAGMRWDRWRDMDPAELFGEAVPTDVALVHVAIAAPDPAAWVGATADRIVDLTDADLSPESFTVTAAAAGAWFVALATRTDAALTTGGDPTGVLGQAARLGRIVEGLSAGGRRVWVLARGGAGHAARIVADASTGVDRLVTLGTPWSTVSFDAARAGPSADIARLLASLLPAVDPDEPDDDQLSLGRSLVRGLLGAAGRAETTDVTDLAAPLPDVAVRADLDVQAWFGDLPLADVQAALTAVTAAGMWQRVVRDAPAALAAATGADAGFSIPVSVGTGVGGITLAGDITVGLAGSDLDLTVESILDVRPAITVRLRISDDDGWLVGGPGSALVPDALPIDLRHIDLSITLGLGADGTTGSSGVVLHEGSAFGVSWHRLTVRPNVDVTGNLDDDPLLPEARAVLSALVSRLQAEASGSPGRLAADLMSGTGLALPEAGFVPDALAHLLHDPGAYVRALLADPSRRDDVIRSIVALVPGLSFDGTSIGYAHTAASGSVDVATGRIDITAASTTAGIEWQLDIDGAGTDAMSAGITVGRDHPNALRLAVETAPFRAEVRRRTSTGLDMVVPIWPAPDVDRLWDLGRGVLIAEATRLVLEGVRGLDHTVDEVVTALADGLGILAAAADGAATGQRAIESPIALLTEPADWLARRVFADAGGGVAFAPVERLFEAAKPFLGAESSPRGMWEIVDGVSVTISSGAGGPRLGLAIDPGRWLGGDGRPAFVAGVAAQFTMPADGPPAPAMTAFVGVPDDELTPSAVHVSLDVGSVSVFLRRHGATDLALFPHPAGIGALIGAGVEALLPRVLDAVAALDGGTAGEVGAFVGALGRGLGVATGGDTPGSDATFSPSALQALAADPRTVLAARSTALVTAIVDELDAVVGGLPGAPTVALAGADLVITVRGVVVRVAPSPLTVTVVGSADGVDTIDEIGGSITIDTTGITAWSLDVGPATLPIGGPVLRPALSVAMEAAAGWRVDAALALDGLDGGDDGHRELVARWREADGLSMVATTVEGVDVVERFDPPSIATAAVAAVVDLLGARVLGVPEVATMLDRQFGTPPTSARELMQGSLLSADGTTVRAGMIDDIPASLVALAHRLATSLPTLPVDPFTLALRLDGDVVTIELGLVDPAGGLPLTTGDVVLSLVGDADWIEPPGGDTPDAGLQIGLLRVPAALGGPFEAVPGFTVNGVGLRISGSSGPLVDDGVRLVAAAVHGFGKIVPSGGGVVVSGGIQVELEGLAVPLGAGGGDNEVAQGILSDAGDGGNPPAPGFDPALAAQSHAGGGGVALSLRAGSGDGPWYLPIQRAFGPVYLEQIGLGVGYDAGSPRRLQWISLSLDGNVSLLGLTAAVDKLRLTYHVTRPFFDLGSWEVDVDGFAISSDLGGLTLVGGLRKVPLAPPGSGIEYLGTLKIEFSGYGLSLFGGYAKPTGPQGTYASFFAFGALLAPLGGPPAFFITGIGLGFGINRELERPTVDNLPTNPFLNALRVGGSAPEPMEQLEQLRANIRPARGEHWVAAGVSFTSFVLVTGEVVIVVQFGDGLDVAVLGLARVQLPGPPPAALVSIELALLARFSTKEGLLLIQAQLTENSWLLDPSIRLTGGFAFATWWKGPNAGQFVVTIGGYHPRFHRDGYPIVPRVGINWSPSSNVVVKGESYFALCSEAIMAGISVEASARFGPAYARLSFGGDGIVFFDPFWFSVSAHAEVAAGIRINVLFGTITVEVSLGVAVEVSGPPVYIEGRFKICGFTVPFEIGDRGNEDDHGLTAAEFEAKYLRADDGAQPIQASVVKGGMLPGRSRSGHTEKVPDGTAALPFRLTPEFELTVLTTVPMTALELIRPELPDVPGAGDRARESVAVSLPANGLGVAPMKATLESSTLEMVLVKSDTDDIPYSIDDIQLVRESTKAAFPKGVWGVAQNPQAPSVPEGKVVHAEDRITLRTTLPDSDFTGAVPIDYHQIELPLGGRKPLPFVTDRTAVNARRAAAGRLRDIADRVRPADGATDDRYLVAAALLSVGGSQPTTVAALRGERVATPSIASLADDLAEAPEPVSTSVEPVVVTPVTPVEPIVQPHVRAILSTSAATAMGGTPRTTVSTLDATAMLRTPPPTIAATRERLGGSSPTELLVRRLMSARDGSTVLADRVPVSRLASMPTGSVANARVTDAQRDRIDTSTGRLHDGGLIVNEGELVVVRVGATSGAGSDVIEVTGGDTRLVAMAAGGRVLDDLRVDGERAELPVGTERLVIIPHGEGRGVGGTVAGWYAGQSLPTVGWDLAIAGGAAVRFSDAKPGRSRERHDGGWANTRELAVASRIVTRFDEAVTAVAIAVDDSGVDSLDQLEVGLLAATRTLDDGVERPPRILTAGVRTVLVFDVVPDGSGDVSVVIDGTRRVRISAVAGARTGSAALCERLVAGGVEPAIRPPLSGGTGRRRVTWTTRRNDG